MQFFIEIIFDTFNHEEILFYKLFVNNKKEDHIKEYDYENKEEINANETFIPENDGVLGIDPETGLKVIIKKGPQRKVLFEDGSRKWVNTEDIKIDENKIRYLQFDN